MFNRFDQEYLDVVGIPTLLSNFSQCCFNATAPETKVYARFPVIDDLRSEDFRDSRRSNFLSLSLKRKEVINRKKIYTSTATFQTVSQSLTVTTFGRDGTDRGIFGREMAIERRLHYFATACQTSNRNPSTSTTKFDRGLETCCSSAISYSSIRD